MSAVPEAKAGVGSAMSDVTRQVGGALGVAVIGSIIASAYSHDMSGAPEAASESVGAAHAVAGQIGGSAGQQLADTAGQAFTQALGVGLTAAAAVALAGAVLVLWRLPSGRAPLRRRARPAGRCVGVQRRPPGLRRAPLAYGLVVDSVNVSVLLYVPERSGSLAPMLCENAICTASLDVGPVQRLDGRRQRVPAHQQRLRQRERAVDEAPGGRRGRIGDRQRRVTRGEITVAVLDAV